MREFLRSQLDVLQSAWRDGLSGEVKRTAIAFPFLAVLAFCACTALPDLRDRLVGLVLSTMNSLNVTDQNGDLSALGLLANNMQACVFVMVYGLIPFIYLPALSLGLNAMLLGVLAAWYLSEGMSLLAYLAALLPHGIFELPALVLAIAVGLYICGQTTRRFRRDESALPAWTCLALASRILLLVLLPLLAAAALMEAYVTPLIAALFL